MTEIFEKEYEVKMLDFEASNPIIPIVLIDKKERNLLRIELEKKVKIKKKVSEVTIETIAIVHPQFVSLINQEVASTNKLLAEKLELKIGDKIVISKEVTESESEKFDEEVQQKKRQLFMNGMGFA